MKRSRQDISGITYQAAKWYTALQEADAAEQGEFAQWIVQSPLHVQEFLNVTAVHRLFDQVDAARSIDVEGLLRTCNQASRTVGTVIPLEGRATPPASAPRARRRPFQYLAAGIAATVIVAATALLLTETLPWDGGDRYSTGTGEQRAVELTDGSLLHLSAQSRVRVHFNPRGRDIQLMEGEALFSVKHDAHRPFRVHVGETIIQAIGTQFNVNRRTRDVTVAVIEGVVQVTDAARNAEQLRAGELAHIALTGTLAERSHLNPARATAWRQRRLVFQADTLDDMAQEFNRYNRTPKIRIEGADVGQRRFTGVLDASNPDALLNLLLETDDLIAAREDGELIIRKIN